MKHLLIALLAAVSFSAMADDLVGTWTLSMEMPQGTRNSDLVVRTEGEGLAGTLIGTQRTTEIPAIERDGNMFSFELKFESPQMGPIAITYKGTQDGNSLSGQVESPQGSLPFTGVRKAAAE